MTLPLDDRQIQTRIHSIIYPGLSFSIPKILTRRNKLLTIGNIAGLAFWLAENVRNCDHQPCFDVHLISMAHVVLDIGIFLSGGESDSAMGAKSLENMMTIN